MKAANWLSHLEFDWQSPVWRYWWESFSQDYNLIRYDERGCGLSDWDVPDFSFDAWVRIWQRLLMRLHLIDLRYWEYHKGGSGDRLCAQAS